MNMFPEVLNLYGDRGNIICLQKRCVWRGIKANIFEYNLGAGQEILKSADIILLGGASDREQSIVYSHLINLKGLIKSLIEDGIVVLAICGGYQLLGEAYIDASGRAIKGLHLLDFITKAEGKDLLVTL